MTTSNIFKSSELWEKYGLTPDYRERLKIIRSLIPQDIKSILDIDCGKGEIINAISQDNRMMTIVGADLALQAINYVNGNALIAGLPKMPFSENSFDLVLCLQVLEHISDVEYLEALRELQRLANRHLIVGLPVCVFR